MTCIQQTCSHVSINVKGLRFRLHSVYRISCCSAANK